MKPDPIIEIVRSIDLGGAIFLNAEFTAPWAITAHVTKEDCRPFMDMPRQVIAYHVVLEGEFSVSVTCAAGGEYQRRAKPGDVLIFPHNREHRLGSAPDLAPVCGDDLILPRTENGLAQIRYGGGGDKVRILCGFMGSNAISTPLLDVMPEMLIVPIEALETRNWIESSVAMAAKRLRTGELLSEGMMSDMSRLLLAEALRLCLNSAEQSYGWLNGMAHPQMAKVLARIHCAMQNMPTVAELASISGMSRSVFVERFTSVFGMGPQQYMIDERMKRAAALLRDGDLTSAEVGLKVGYDAPEAFSRAFKRHFGKAPKNWRDETLQAAA